MKFHYRIYILDDLQNFEKKIYVNNMDLFCFYDNTLNEISFNEPKNNEIYINKDYFEQCFLDGLVSNLRNILHTLEKADESNLLPELRSFIENDENNLLFNKFKTFPLKFVSHKTMDDLTNDDIDLLEKASEILSPLYKNAFKRLYVFNLLGDMRELNEECEYNNTDLVYGSSFFEDYIARIGEDGTSTDIFDECLEYIKNDVELKKIALRCLHYYSYYYYYEKGFSIECDNYYSFISNRFDNQNAKSIDDSVWESFINSFDRDVTQDDEMMLLYSNYSLNNIKKIDPNHDAPSLELDIDYPKKVYFKNAQGNSGSFDVVGLFEEKYSTNITNAYFANEDYVNIIGTAPESFCYVINDFQYDDSSDSQYNYLIVKTDFTLDKVKEITAINNGIQLRFANEEIKAADQIFIVLEQFYEATILGSVIFGFFAVLLLINFITNSISFRRKEIGILRCLGARNVDIYKIFMTESLLISAFSTVVASVFSIVACSIGNSIICDYFTFSVLHFGFLNFVVVLCSCIFFSFIGTLIPILRTSKMTPASIIRHE